MSAPRSARDRAARRGIPAAAREGALADMGGLGVALLGTVLCIGCGEPADEAARCGPASGVVTRVVDGDTIELASGEKVRYLLVDTPEISGGEEECYGPEAKELNSQLVLSQEVQLTYDEECRDRYDRLLAYVSLSGREINSLLVQRGYACVLYIAPNGADRRQELEGLEFEARSLKRGMWGDGVCQEKPCR